MSEEIEKRLEEAQSRITSSVLAIGTFLADKAAGIAESAADLAEKTAKNITGKEVSDFPVAPKPDASKRSTRTKPAKTSGDPTVN